MSEAAKRLENVKKEIRSVVISVQKGLSLKQLDKDYRSMLGENIPYRELGYNNMVEFIKDIPDVVTVNWTSSVNDYWLTAIANDELKHIEKLIQKQRSKPGKKNTGYSSRVSRHTCNPPARFHSTPKVIRQSLSAPLEANIRSLVAMYPNGLSLTVFEHEYMQKYGLNLIYTAHGFTTLESCLQVVTGIKIDRTQSETKVYLAGQSPKEGNISKARPQFNFSQINSLLPQGDFSTLKTNYTINTNSAPNRDGNEISFHDLRNQSICDKIKPTKLPQENALFSEMYANGTVNKQRPTELVEDGVFAHGARNQNQFWQPDKNVKSPSPLLNYTQSSNKFSAKEIIGSFSSNSDRNQTPSLQKTKCMQTLDTFNECLIPSAHKMPLSPLHENDKSNLSGSNKIKNFPSQSSKTKKLLDTVDDVSSDTLSRSTSSLSTSCTISSSDNCSVSHEIGIYANDSVNETLKDEFRQVMERHPGGIWATTFPSTYEKITGKELDLNSIGFYSLLDLLNALPDVFVTERPQGSSGDWLIRDVRRWKPTREIRKTYYCAGQPTDISNLDVSEETKFSIIKLLQGFPDGILLEDLDIIYEENCGEPLPWVQLGFFNIKEFVVALSKVMPLDLESIKGALSIKLKDDKQTSKIGRVFDSTPVTPYAKCIVDVPVKLPSDAVDPESSYTYQKFPPNLVSEEKFIGVYVSHVDTPSQIYLQLREDGFVQNLDALMDDLEDVYFDRTNSEKYKMPDSKIIIGNICVALWPEDNNWHRVKICGIPSINTVEVFYVDYGSRGKVSKYDLRLLRKEFLMFPAQAIKAKLESIEPPNKEQQWSKEACQRLLQMCLNKRLMALVKLYGESISVCLCDTTGESDLHINDQLVEEGYAVFDNMEDRQPHYPRGSLDQMPQSMVGTPQTSQAATAALITNQYSSVGNNTLLQNLLAQALLQLQASNLNSLNNLPTDISNLSTLLAQCSLSDDSKLSSSSHAHVSSPIQNGIKSQSIPASPDSINNLSSLKPTAKLSPITSLGRQVGVAAAVPRTQDNLKTQETEDDSDDDVLGDDDDELIRQLCDNLEKRQKKYIKRLHLKDSYKVNLINYKNMPFMTDGDISSLFWNHNDPHLLNMRLRMKYLTLQPVIVPHEGNENLFEQMLRYKVRGIKESTVNVTLYPLSNVITIVNDFGHPSVSLLRELKHELSSFDPNSEDWMHLQDGDYYAEEDKMSITSDDSDISRLCLDDLRFCLNGLRNNRVLTLSIISNEPKAKELNSCVEKLKSIDNQIQLVQERIRELEHRQGIQHQHEVSMTERSTMRRSTSGLPHYHLQMWTNKR